MPDVTIQYRTGATTVEIPAGCTLFEALVGSNIPPDSVVVYSDSEILTETHTIREGEHYTAVVPESYDLAAIRELYEDSGSRPTGYYTKRRIAYEPNQDIRLEQAALSRDEFESYIEQKIGDTISHYDLVSPGDTVLLGLSGEGDSLALLYVLDALDLDTDLRAVTIQEPWETESDGLETAVEHVSKLDIPHRVVTLDEIAEIYGLEHDLQQLLVDIRETTRVELYSDILGQIHKNVLERVAEETGAERICMAAHASELISNVLMSTLLGLDSSQGKGIPKETIGDISYVYPACFTSKKELYLYHLTKVGEDPTDTTPDIWVDLPKLESFEYFIGDLLRSYWPGIEYWLFRGTDAADGGSTYARCANCNKRKSTSSEMQTYVCTVCDLLDQV